MTATLANPWGLLALFSLPLIVWLHRYVTQGEQRQVSSLALWLDAEEVALEGSKARRPPPTPVLWLELLAALALSLWLAGLDLKPPAETTPHLGLIVDGTASMAGGRGADAPLAQAARLLDTLAARFPEARYSVVVADARPRLLGEPRLSAAQARRALEALSPGGTARDFDAALELLGALGVTPSSAFILSDDPQLEHPRLVRVGAASTNLGFVHAHWLDGAAPFAALRNFSGSTVKVALRVAIDDGPETVAQTLELGPGEEQPLSIDVAPGARRVTLSLPGDALAIDDRVTLLSPPARGVALEPEALVPALDAALERVRAAVPLYRSTTPLAALQVRMGDAPAPPNTRVLRVLQADGTLQQELQLDPFSELLTGIELRGLVWYAAAAATPEPTAQVLVRSTQGPLLWRAGRELVLNVDLARSNLLAHSAFPILLANLATEIDRESGGLTRRNFHVGETLALERSQELQGAVELRDPGGGALRFESDKELLLGRLEQRGEYTLKAANGEQSFAVGFLDARESDLQGRAARGPLPELRESKTEHDASGSLLQGPLGLLALGCLLGAWRLANAGRRRA